METTGPSGATVHPDWRARAALALLVFAWGTQALVTQSLLLREAMVLMYGSELAWGLVLFAWLLGVAVGAALGGRAAASALARRHAAPVLIAVLVALSAAACLELWLFRGARGWLGVSPGEILPLPRTALAALLLVAPASALVGAAFPIACCVVVGRDRSTAEPSGSCLSFGRIYALESLGSLIGGTVFSFWAVEHLHPVQTALLCGALTCAASCALLLCVPHANVAAGLRTGRHVPVASLLALATLGAVLLALFAGDALNRRLVDRRWRNIAPGYELVADAESKYQNLALGARAGQYTLYCDGHVTADFPDPYTFVPLAHFWLCQHPDPRRVLVLGGGAEGLISEILRHPIEHVDYVETDPRQIELVRPYLAEADRRALADPRVTVHSVDPRYFVKTQRDRFDLVIARLPEPTSALHARFYTDEFYGELRRAMTARAVVCLTAAATPTELSQISREYLATLRATLQRHFPHVVVGWGDPAQVLAATQAGLVTTDPAVLEARYARRGVTSALFDPAWFAGATDWLSPDKLARRAADLDAAGPVPICRDLHPLIYVQRLVLWEAQSGGRAPAGPSKFKAPTLGERGMIARLRAVRPGHAVLALGALGAVVLAWSRLRRGPRAGWAAGAITLSVGSTGFVTMALSIVWLFAFQNLYGYVYQRIGWIIALFMAGLVVGCLLGSRHGSVAPDEREKKTGTGTAPAGSDPHEKSSCGACTPFFLTRVRRSWRWLIAVDVLLALLALVVPLVLPALSALQDSPARFTLVEWCISLLVVATGVLGGAAFPLAGQIQLRFTGHAGATAGTVVSADHAGACLGALLCGILLIPVLGTATAAYLLAGMKVCSAGLLALGCRFSPAH